MRYFTMLILVLSFCGSVLAQTPVPDAGVVEPEVVVAVPEPDAGVTGSEDAGAVVPVTPDAGLDVPDAEVPDAEVPDAEVPDAEVSPDTSDLAADTEDAADAADTEDAADAADTEDAADAMDVSAPVATTPTVPETAEELGNLIGQLLDAAKNGEWTLVGGLFILLLVWFFNRMGMAAKVGSQAVPWVALATGVVVASATALIQGTPIVAALKLGLLEGGVAIALWETVGKHAKAKPIPTPPPAA